MKQILIRAARSIGLRPVRAPPYIALSRPFRFRRRALSAALGEATVSTSDEHPGLSTELGKLWLTTESSHKWPHYFPIYERVLSKYQGKTVRLLEIGVENGGSLRLWRKYLGEGATIVGIDINPDCMKHDDRASGVNVRIGSQADTKFLDELTKEFGPFDAIIDDGSHFASHIVASFQSLFPQALVAEGVYIVEDVHALYWESHRDSRFDLRAFVGDIVDLKHAHYWNRHTSQFMASHPNRLPHVSVSALGKMLGRIEIEDSVVIVHKNQSDIALPANIRLMPAEKDHARST